ncbi:zinc-binding dehydrogenase, partial [Jiangella anatolica]
GGVGLSAVMGAALAGAHPVVAVDTVPSKLSLATSLGATHVVSASEPDVVGAIRELTGGGADHALECVGSAAVLETAFAATARGGTTVAVGLPDPSHRAALPAVTLTGEGRVLRGSYMGSAAPARDIPRLIRLWEAGKLPVELLRTSTLGFDDLPAAFDELAAGRAVRQLLRPSAS